MLFRGLFNNSIASVSDLRNPQDWLIELVGGTPTSSGERVTSDNAIFNSNIYTVSSILGGDIGKLPIQIFKKRPKGGIEKDTLHPVTYLLGTRPNPYMSAYIFKELMEVHKALWGNGYAYIDWDAFGYPKALWPLDPSKTDVRLDVDTGEVWYFTTLPNGEQRKMPWYDVLHLKRIGKSGLKGITPISVVREKIGNQQSMDKFTGSFYANGTSSRGILKVPTTIDRNAKERVREEWQKVNSGLTNAHKIAILDGGLDYQNIGMPLKDAEFIETQKFGILETAKIYKIPGYKLGVMDQAKFKNVEQQSLEYVKNTLLPLITDWEQEINYKLFTRRESGKYYSKFNINSELRGDSESRAKYYETMVNNGLYTINEVRALEEMNDIGELGDKHFISLNYTTLELLEQYQKAKSGATEGGEGGEE